MALDVLKHGDRSKNRVLVTSQSSGKHAAVDRPPTKRLKIDTGKTVGAAKGSGPQTKKQSRLTIGTVGQLAIVTGVATTFVWDDCALGMSSPDASYQAHNNVLNDSGASWLYATTSVC